MKNLYIFSLLILGLQAIFAQSPQPPITQKTIMYLSNNRTDTVQWVYNWTGWNFVENKDVYRPRNGRDTLLIYEGNSDKGWDIYTLVPRKGTPGSTADKFKVAQLMDIIKMNCKTFSTDEQTNLYQAKLLIVLTYPPAFCDKDVYPYPRILDEQILDKQMLTYTQSKADAMRVIGKLMNLKEGSVMSFEEKHVMYDLMKKMEAISLTREGKKYTFSLNSSKEVAEEMQYMKVEGKLGVEGQFSEVKNTSISPLDCSKP